MSYGGNGERDPRTGVDEAPFPEPETGLRFYQWAHEISDEIMQLTWMVQRMILKGRLYQVFGKYKSGKSVAVLDMCCHLAAGMAHWGGRRIVQAVVIWVAGEADVTTKLRIRAWAKRHGVDRRHMAIVVRECGMYINEPGKAADLGAEIDVLKKVWPGLPVFVVVDTLRATMSGDENSAEEMQAWFDNFRARVIRPHKATGIVIHHSGHGDGSRGRGSSALPGTVDGTLRVSKEEKKPAIIQVKEMETRDGAADADLSFRLDVMEMPGTDNFGDPNTAPVLQFAGEGPRQDAKGNRTGLGAKQKEALKLLEQLQAKQESNLEEGGYPTDSARVSETDWKDACIARGYCDVKKFWDIKTTLTERNLIQISSGFVSMNPG